MKCRRVFVGVFLALCHSCTPSLEKPYRENRVRRDLASFEESQLLDSAEIILLENYLICSENLSDKTYNDILIDAKDWKGKQEQLALKSRRDQALEINIFEKTFYEKDWRSYIILEFVIENKSSKNIRAFKGSVVFTNLFNEEISSINLYCDHTIPAGEVIRWTEKKEFNPYLYRDLSLKDKALNDLKIIWVPEKIIFTDNTVL